MPPQPTLSLNVREEIARRVIIDGESQPDVAEEFGIKASHVRYIVQKKRMEDPLYRARKNLKAHERMLNNLDPERAGAELIRTAEELVRRSRAEVIALEKDQ